MGHQHGPSHPKRVYNISILIEIHRPHSVALGTTKTSTNLCSGQGVPLKVSLWKACPCYCLRLGKGCAGKERNLFSSRTCGHPPQCSFGLFKCTLILALTPLNAHCLRQKPQSHCISCQPAEISKYPHLDNFAPWYHVGTWGDHALRLHSITIPGQKRLQAFLCCSQ